MVLVLERVQRALPAIDVPVATLDAWLVHYCWHGRSPRVRSPSVGNCWDQNFLKVLDATMTTPARAGGDMVQVLSVPAVFPAARLGDYLYQL